MRLLPCLRPPTKDFEGKLAGAGRASPRFAREIGTTGSPVIIQAGSTRGSSLRYEGLNDKDAYGGKILIDSSTALGMTLLRTACFRLPSFALSGLRRTGR
jgi:hypothetical protein